MRSVWQFLGRILFWRYDRGTVPYDLLVIVIVAFVFLSPRRWFHDQPDIVTPSQQTPVVCLAEGTSTAKLRCRVDASLLPRSERPPELQERVHELLRTRAAELKGRTFAIEQIQPVPGDDGAVLYYDVSVKP